MAAAMRLREGGAEVSVVSRASGATALGGGCVDFAGFPVARGAVDPGSTPAERIAALLASNPFHPYHRLVDPGDCARVIEEGVRAVDAWTGREGLHVQGRSDHSLRLCDTQGAVRIADAALESVARGDLSESSEVGVVAMPGLRTWNAAATARRLAAEIEQLGGVALDATALEVAWPTQWNEAGEVPARLAALLDDPGAMPALVLALQPVARPGRTLLLPPVLGLDPANPLAEALEQRLGVAVAECAGTAPLQLQGVRLQRALERALERAGGEWRRAEVRSLEVPREGGRIRLSMDDELEPFDAAVLATGRFVGGGIREAEARAGDSGAGVRESLLDLPLWDLERGERVDGRPAQSLTRPEYEAEQPLFRIGLACDSHQRPLGSAGRIVSERLFVAGDLLAGFDPATDRSGYGVALLSGIRAGDEALRALGVGGRV